MGIFNLYKNILGWCFIVNIGFDLFNWYLVKLVLRKMYNFILWFMGDKMGLKRLNKGNMN